MQAVYFATMRRHRFCFGLPVSRELYTFPFAILTFSAAVAHVVAIVSSNTTTRGRTCILTVW